MRGPGLSGLRLNLSEAHARRRIWNANEDVTGRALNLPAGDDTLLWYGKAIAAMRKKPIADPTSWRYQSAIHEYFRKEDPNASAADIRRGPAPRG